MMIAEQSEKVKRKIKSVVNKASSNLTKPKRKFMLEMLTGMLSSQSSNLTSISRSLKEDTNIKHTSKRIHRNISTSGEFLEISNIYSLHSCKSMINEQTLICLDGGDISYSHAKGYEFMSMVRDGSLGQQRLGYPLNLLVCRNGNEAPFPVLLEVFNRCSNYVSDNFEMLRIIERFMAVHGTKGIWTLDRGYDSKLIMEYILERGGSFNIRQKGTRHLIVNGQPVSARNIASGITRRYKYKDGSFGYKKCYLGNYPVTLVYYKYGNVDLMLLSSGHITKKRIACERIKGYLQRWGVEESYKFIKQSFGLERSAIKKFAGIKSLLGIILLAWKVIEDVSRDEDTRAIVENSARVVKKQITFYYYRIISGIKNIFSLYHFQ
jgi:hypothetical protein